MSGTCAFLLKNAIKDLCLDLGRVTAQHLDAPRRTIYLGMDTGEIVSLKSEMLQEKITLSPKLLLSPSFETIKCEVVGLHVAETPFHNMTDSSEMSLVSIHADGRIRLWDIQDGKCLLVSRDGKLANPKEIVQMGHLNEGRKRFLYVLEKDGTAYYLDLWLMKTYKINPNDHVPVVGVKYSQHVVYALDQDEKIRIYELVGLNSPLFFDYIGFLNHSDEVNQVINGHRSLSVQEAFAPIRKYDNKITDSLLSLTNFLDPPINFHMDDDIIYFVYKRKVIIYLKKEILTLGNVKDFEKMKSSRSTYHSISWEFEGVGLNTKNIVKSLLAKNSSLVLFFENMDYYTIGKADIMLLFSVPEDTSMNVLSKDYKGYKMKGTLGVTVSVKPSSSVLEGLEPSTRAQKVDILFDPSTEYFFILDKTKNLVSIYSLSMIATSTPMFIQTPEGVNSNSEKSTAPVTFSLSSVVSFQPPASQSTTSPTVASALFKVLNPALRKSLTEEVLSSALDDFLSPKETATTFMYATLDDGQVYLVLGTNEGNLFLLKVFAQGNEDVNIFVGKQLCKDIEKLDMFNNILFCSSRERELILLRFNCEVNHQEVKRHEIRRDKALSIREINGSQLKKVEIPNHLRGIMPLVYLSEDTIQDPDVKAFYSSLIGLVLSNNQLVLFDLASFSVVFEHRFSENSPLGIYFDKRTEFLSILFDSGDIDVFNVNTGNIMMLIQIRNAFHIRRTGSMYFSNPSVAQVRIEPTEEDTLAYETKLFTASCFTYERSISLGTYNLNLVDLLKDYKNTYVDFKSFSKFASCALINVTQDGSIFEYATQFFTNELLSVHIEYPNLKKGVITARPTPTEEEKKKEKTVPSTPKGKPQEDIFFGVTSMKELNALVEQQQVQNKAREEEIEAERSGSIMFEKIPIKLQNVLERNILTLIKERLDDEPLRMLESYDAKGEDAFSQRGQYNKKDLLRMITYMNYANQDIFADSKSKENSIVFKKNWNKQTEFMLVYYPPVFDAAKPTDNPLKVASLFIPLGIDLQSELEIKAAFGEGFPVVSTLLGVQGVSESFSFILDENFFYIDNKLAIQSPRRMSSQAIVKKESLVFSISPYVTTSFMLAVVSELIFVLKRGYNKVQPLINAIRTLFFEAMPYEVKQYSPVSQKILTLLTLNDKLLVSASAHFILNNIYDLAKLPKDSQVMDPAMIDNLLKYFAIIKNPKGYKETEVLSILCGISKFELFVISMLLFYLRLPHKKDEKLLVSREEIIRIIHPVIEIKISMSYPFMVIPVIKICLEALPYIDVRNNQPIFKRLFHSVAYFSLYYGLTFEPNDPENPTYVNSSLLLEENLPSSKSLKEFVSSLKQQSYEVRRGIRVHILKLLKLLGEMDIGHVLYMLNEMISTQDVSKLVAYNVIDIIKYMVKFCEADFNAHIATWTDILMKSLNPNKPEIRKFCQGLSTSSMKSLLKRYHFCSFHKDSQHLFVPGNSNEIIIYDLRTAMRWKSLKGHEGLIECIAVQDGGQIVASFSRKDKEIKLWKIHSSGFFENILGNSTQLYRSIRVKEEIPLHAELKLTWINNDKQIELSAPKENFRVVLGGT